jgi:hypothetical protein
VAVSAEVLVTGGDGHIGPSGSPCTASSLHAKNGFCQRTSTTSSFDGHADWKFL